VSATGCSQPPYPALTQTTRAIKKNGCQGIASLGAIRSRHPMSPRDALARTVIPNPCRPEYALPCLSDSGTSPIFDRLSDRAGVNGQVAAMLDVDQDTLEEMLILVSIVVVIAMLLWKAFRSSKAR